MEGSETSSNLGIEEQSLEDVVEDPESGDSETATEVAVSEKALKFKISTEGSLNTGRKSYPGSRKGSRERVQHFNSTELAKVMQKGKLRAGAFSFDQHCVPSHKKFSFDNHEFLDECAIALKKRFEENQDQHSESEDDAREAECVISKETLNLNKRNSEHNVKIPPGSIIEEKRSILKTSDSKTFTNEEKLRMNNTKTVSSEDYKDDVSVNPSRNKGSDDIVRKSSATNSSDNPSSILQDKVSVQSDNDSKNNRTIFSRIKQFTDRFSLSMDRDTKLKNIKFSSFKNNNQRTTLPKSKKNLETQCCKSLENLEERRASTLPKTKKLIPGRKGWKQFILGKDKPGKDIEFWASDADVNKLSASAEIDNQSLPSTSQSQSSCTINTSPKVQKSETPAEERSSIKEKAHPEPILDNNLVNSQMSKLQEIQADQILVVSNEAESNLI